MHRRWDKSKPPTGPWTLNQDSWKAQGLILWYPLGLFANGSTGLIDQAGSGYTNPTPAATLSPVTLGEAGEPNIVYDGSSIRFAMFGAGLVPALLQAAPVAVAAWVNPTVVNGISMTSWGQFGAAGNRWGLDFSGSGLRWYAGAAGTYGIATKSGAVANTLMHVMGCDVTIASRYAAINGVASTPDTTSKAPTVFTLLQIGAAFDNSVVTTYFSGRMGEFCFWNRAFDPTKEAPAVADPGTRFELWYPLRSRKWISVPASGVLLSRRYYDNQIGMVG